MISRPARLNHFSFALCVGAFVGSLSGCEREPAKPQAAAVTTTPEIEGEKIEQSLTAAQEYMAGQKLAEAKAILARLVERAPNEVRGRELYGQVLALEAGKALQRAKTDEAQALYRQAYEQYRAAVELDPTSAGLQHSAGMVAMSAGDRAAALGHFQAARRLDDRNPQYPLFEAQILIQDRRFDEARAALEHVIKLDASQAYAHASLAMIALELNQFETATKHITTARQLTPDDVALRAQEARIHRRSGNPTRALELLVGLSEADRAQEVVAFEIAAAHSELGDHHRAAKAWELVHRRNPAGPRAWLAAVRTGEALIKAGERDQAWLWLQQAKLAAPKAQEVAALEASLQDATINR